MKYTFCSTWKTEDFNRCRRSKQYTLFSDLDSQPVCKAMVGSRYGGDETVLFTRARSDGFSDDSELSNDEEDVVHIEKKSLLPENKPAKELSRKTKRNCCCAVQRLPACSSVLAGTLCLIVGLIIGVLIGRLSIHNSQSEDSNPNILKISQSNMCNCSKPSTDTLLSPATTATTSSTPDDHSTSSCNVCKTRNPNKSIGNESKTSLFAPMTKNEMNAVILAIKSKGYASYDRRLRSKRVSHIYLHPAVKSEVLAHLDNNSIFPGRFAKVHVYRPTNDPPDVMEYRVGPLNESSDNMIVEKLREDGEIHFNRRPYDVAEASELYVMLRQEVKAIAALMSESFDRIGDSNFDFSYLPTSDMSDRTSNVALVSKLGRPSTLELLPVSCTAHHPGTDVSKWYTSDWYYFDQGPYNSATELQEAYASFQLRKIKFPTKFREDHKGDYDRVRNVSLPARDLSDIPPPRTYEPQGPRYTINGHTVTWMGWQFEVTSNPVRGPAVFDVKFQGERIAYEISLQDITLLYSSQTNGHGPAVLSDTLFSIGGHIRPIFNVDCPKRSKILQLTNFLSGTPIVMDSVCVFEADAQRPLWRHGSRGLADHYLVIRAPLALGNYDYVFEWNFHLDGRLQTQLTASGYLFGAFWNPYDYHFTPFGYRLSDYLLGPIHDHTFTFKIDLDIYGTENSFQTVHWKSGSTRDAFRSQTNVTEKPGYFYFNTTRYVSSEILKLEDSFILDSKKPKVWTVVNENKKNSWGAQKGYRVIPHSKYAEILEDHMMFPVWDHVKYQLAVTKRKESEPYATNSLYDITHPVKMEHGSGQMKLDNDPVQNEDLVLWISEKFYHLPTSEDIPMTLPASVGFTLKPFNYFDRTPVFDLPAHYSKQEPYENKPCYVND